VRACNLLKDLTQVRTVLLSSHHKTPEQKREEYEAQEVRRYVAKNYTDLEITGMLNISMSKLMHYKKILGAEVLKKYTPENYAKIVATTNIKFKERMLFVIRTCNQTPLSNPEASARDKLINEKLKRKTFVEMVRHLAKAETDLTFQENDSELQEEFRRTVTQARQIKSKIDLLDDSEIDKLVNDWLSWEEAKKKKKNSTKSQASWR
jgi:hypothetical protein